MNITESCLKPTGYHLLLKTEQVETKTASGIITMTDKEEERQKTGNELHTVVSMGPDAYKSSDPDKFQSGPWCKVGDLVMTARYPGAKTEIDGELYYFANDEDILATVETDNG